MIFSIITQSKYISNKKTSRKVQKNKGKRKKAGKVGSIFMEREKKGKARTRTRMLKGPDTACEPLRGRVDVPDGAWTPA